MSTNAFDLQARVSLDTSQYEKGLKEASADFSTFSDSVKDSFGKLAKVSTAALGAAAAGVTALVKDSVASYGEYEQLVGGIETLFGQSADKVLENADKAFETAGMDVNKYMETSIQSAASLINALGGDTEKAADLMNMSIIDMSDNVNKMGTTMESVQNAYRGFSRGNFTMLDNLALGFSGTKEGMQELLDKAEQISGIKYDISSYSDIVEAIHVVQTEMGITGTTAEEAADTITGSIGSMKSAWKNLVIELAKPDGDVSKAFSRLGDNVGGVIENTLPKVENALSGVGDLIAAAAPQVTSGLKRLLPKVLPSLLKTATSLVTSVGSSVIQAMPELVSASGEMIKELFKGFEKMDLGPFNWLKEDALTIVTDIKDVFKSIDFDRLKDAFLNVGLSLNKAMERIGDGVTWASENVIAPLLTWAGNDVIPNMFDALAGAIDLCTTAIDLFKTPALAVWDGFLKPIAEGAGDVIVGTFDLMGKALGGLAEEFDGVDWSGYWDDINNGEFFANWKSGFEEIEKWFSNHDNDIEDFFDVSDIGNAWREFWEGVGGSVYETQERWTNAFTLMKETYTEFAEDFQIGKDIIRGAIQEIKDKFNEFVEAWRTGWDVIKGFGEEIDDSFSNSNTVAGLAYNTLKNKLPFFGEGGYVSSPTLAVVGEKGPEYIVPERKMNDVNSNVTNNIYITGTWDLSNPNVVRPIAEQISSELENLSIAQQRALGGVGWQ